jgi:hypothetical protein
MIQKSAYCSVAGNGADGWSCRVADWRLAMGIDWMTRAEITQAIPPAYTEHMGRYLLGVLCRPESEIAASDPGTIEKPTPL